MNKGVTIRRIPKVVQKASAPTDAVEETAEKCQNPSYDCSLQPEVNHKMCIKHIHKDPTATMYKQCSYVYVNGKQCSNRGQVVSEDRKEMHYLPMCFEHSRMTQLSKIKQSVGTYKPVDSTETLVQSLAHHVKLDKVKPQSTTKLSPLDDEEEIDVVTPTVDPFTDLNASEMNNQGRNILDYASDSSSEEDQATTLANTWRSHELDHSDAESVDSDEDLLKNAGIFTIDEVLSISKEKMQRLQTLYIDQFQRLQHVMREKRRKYLQDLKKERETLSSIHDQAKDSPKERKLYKNLKALNHYHKRYGTESLLHRQFLEKRRKQTEPTLMAAPIVPQQKNVPKCIFSEGGVKCNERLIPCSRYCRKHIMEDKKQILFKACGVEKSGIVCPDSVAAVFEENAACVLHTTLPSPRTYVKRKYESETEEEDEGDQAIKMEELEDVEEIETNEVTSEFIMDDEIDMKDEGKIEPTSTDEVIVA